MYGLADDEIALHLYGDSTARFSIAGTPVTLEQTTRYPWDGAIRVALRPERPARFAVSLRIPAWAKGARLAVNGESVDLALGPDGYARIEREWRAGDAIALDLPLEPRRVWANPRVRQDAGRVAVLRGPLVYCAEETDSGPGLARITLGEGATETSAPDLPGAVALDLRVDRDVADWADTLYRTAPPATEPGTARLVPYHLWDNRAPGEMLVWFRSR
jgi:DUF1680 family protein